MPEEAPDTGVGGLHEAPRGSCSSLHLHPEALWWQAVCLESLCRQELAAAVPVIQLGHQLASRFLQACPYGPSSRSHCACHQGATITYSSPLLNRRVGTTHIASDRTCCSILCTGSCLVSASTQKHDAACHGLYDSQKHEARCGTSCRQCRS